MTTIHGRLIEAGDDETGQPRLVIEATREAIKAAVGNLLYRDVTVAIRQAVPQVPQLIATKCCACQRIKTIGGEFVSPDICHVPNWAVFSDGYCPECEAKAWADLNALLPEKKVVDGAVGGGSVAVLDAG